MGFYLSLVLRDRGPRNRPPSSLRKRVNSNFQCCPVYTEAPDGPPVADDEVPYKRELAELIA